jgi:hypothetical protein
MIGGALALWAFYFLPPKPSDSVSPHWIVAEADADAGIEIDGLTHGGFANPFQLRFPAIFSIGLRRTHLFACPLQNYGFLPASRPSTISRCSVLS